MFWRHSIAIGVGNVGGEWVWNTNLDETERLRPASSKKAWSLSSKRNWSISRNASKQAESLSQLSPIRGRILAPQREANNSHQTIPLARGRVGQVLLSVQVTPREAWTTALCLLGRVQCDLRVLRPGGLRALLGLFGQALVTLRYFEHLLARGVKVHDSGYSPCLLSTVPPVPRIVEQVTHVPGCNVPACNIRTCAPART
jgi:hypothetical protein